MASQYGLPKVIAYTASKSAIEGMTRRWLLNYLRGILVNVYCAEVYSHRHVA
jgi:NAD(P)-dependent dehydrogenase (short-subunit alcohol dehydrogenase family)